MSGAAGASLIAMVAGLPKPRVQSPEQERQLEAARGRSVAASEHLAALMDRDSDAYEHVVAAFRLPKGSDQEKRVRSDRIQQALQSATEAPLAVMRACLDSLQAAAEVAAFGNANAWSDVQVGLELMMAGLRGAKLNVTVNLASIKDLGYVDAATTEAAQLETEAESAYKAVLALLSGPRAS
jgi:formiminotetrahydrofolate cyclodeaminase